MLCLGVATNLQVQSSPVVIVTDAEMLANIQRALRDVLTTGQAYTIVGSRSFTLANIADLQKLEQLYRRRVLTAAGFDGKNQADHDNGEDDYATEGLQ